MFFLFIYTAALLLCVQKPTDSLRFVYNKAPKTQGARAYVKTQEQAIHVMLKCANNCSGWLVPPV